MRMERSVIQPVEEKIECRDGRMWSLVSTILHSNDNKTTLRAACRLAKEYKPGLANRRAHKQLYKVAKPRTTQSYLQKRLFPSEILRVLSKDYLNEPRYIRLGKNWITGVNGTKIKIPARELSRIDFLKWLQAEVYRNISGKLLEEKTKEEEDPLNNAVSLDQYPQVSFPFIELGDPSILLEEQQEAQAKTDHSAKILSRMMAEASPQEQKYIENMETLINKDIYLSSLEDKELSRNLDLSPQRIRQIRSALRKKYKKPANKFALYK